MSIVITSHEPGASALALRLAAEVAQANSLELFSLVKEPLCAQDSVSVHSTDDGMTIYKHTFTASVVLAFRNGRVKCGSNTIEYLPKKFITIGEQKFSLPLSTAYQISIS